MGPRSSFPPQPSPPERLGFSVNSAVFANGFPVARPRGRAQPGRTAFGPHTGRHAGRFLRAAAGTATELTLVVTVLLYRCTKRHPQLNRRNWQNKIRACRLPRAREVKNEKKRNDTERQR